MTRIPRLAPPPPPAGKGHLLGAPDGLRPPTHAAPRRQHCETVSGAWLHAGRAGAAQAGNPPDVCAQPPVGGADPKTRRAGHVQVERRGFGPRPLPAAPGSEVSDPNPGDLPSSPRECERRSAVRRGHTRYRGRRPYTLLETISTDNIFQSMSDTTPSQIPGEVMLH